MPDEKMSIIFNVGSQIDDPYHSQHRPFVFKKSAAQSHFLLMPQLMSKNLQLPFHFPVIFTQNSPIQCHHYPTAITPALFTTDHDQHVQNHDIQQPRVDTKGKSNLLPRDIRPRHDRVELVQRQNGTADIRTIRDHEWQHENLVDDGHRVRELRVERQDACDLIGLVQRPVDGTEPRTNADSQHTKEQHERLIAERHDEQHVLGNDDVPRVELQHVGKIEGEFCDCRNENGQEKHENCDEKEKVGGSTVFAVVDGGAE
jgi:hypothetical protein